MLVQLLSLRSKNPDAALDDVPLDPRNQQAVCILFLAVVPLAINMLKKPDTITLLIHGGLLALFGAALYSISLGLKDTERYDSEKVARAPKYPCKLIGSGLLGLGGAILTAVKGGDIGQVILTGLIAFALSLVSFGLDPLKQKGLDTATARQDHRLKQQRERVERRLTDIRGQITPVVDPGLVIQFGQFESAVQRMMQALEADPERHRSLQKYLGVYLDGAVEASARFVAIYQVTADPLAHTRYSELLSDLAEAFDSKATAYAHQGRDKFDVQIDVLNESIAREQTAA